MLIRLTISLMLGLTLMAADQHVRKSVPAQAGGRLVLTTPMGAIHVEPGSGTAVEVDVLFRGDSPSQAEFDRILKDFSLDVSALGNEIRVTPQFRGVWQGPRAARWFGGHQWCQKAGCLGYSWLKELDFRVTVPAKFHASLDTSGGAIQVGNLQGEVVARTSGGSLNFGQIDGPVDGRTSGGSITIRGAKGRALLHTSGGSIRVEETAGEVDASTSGGSIRIRNAAARVRAHTSGGSISVDAANGPVDASTSGGSIELALAASKGYDVDASTTGGGAFSDFPGLSSPQRRPQRLQGSVNGGGSLIRLRTSGGNIHVRRAS